MKEDLKNLYQAVILQHNKTPVNFQKNDAAAYVIEAYNPLCGDRFKLYLDLEGDAITSASFHGYGCAVSKASTSVLVKKLEGKRVAQALEICRAFLRQIQSEEEPATNPDEEIAAFSSARQFPARQQCATLSWDEMLVFLKKLES